MMKWASARIGIPVAAVLLLFTTLALPIGATSLQTLSGVRSMTSDFAGSCALLTSGKVDCWGYDNYGELGNGTSYTTGNEDSAVPVAVEGVGGTGTLSGVASLDTDGVGYCARLTSDNVDCWGGGWTGQLGNGAFYTSGNDGSDVPVAVKGVGGTGTLGGVTSLDSDGAGYCARLTSGNVDCWGGGNDGQLGNGTFYTTGDEGSAVPVAVKGVGERARWVTWLASPATPAATVPASPLAMSTALGMATAASSATGPSTPLATRARLCRWRSKGWVERARWVTWLASPATVTTAAIAPFSPPAGWTAGGRATPVSSGMERSDSCSHLTAQPSR